MPVIHRRGETVLSPEYENQLDFKLSKACLIKNNNHGVIFCILKFNLEDTITGEILPKGVFSSQPCKT